MSILIQRTGGVAAQVKSIYVRDSLNVARKVSKGLIRHTDGTDKVFYTDRYYILQDGVLNPEYGNWVSGGLSVQNIVAGRIDIFGARGTIVTSQGDASIMQNYSKIGIEYTQGANFLAVQIKQLPFSADINTYDRAGRFGVVTSTPTEYVFDLWTNGVKRPNSWWRISGYSDGSSAQAQIYNIWFE